MIRIITVGKKHPPWLEPAIQRYQTRSTAPWDFRWDLVSSSSLKDADARSEESARIMRRLRPDEIVILLDETGQMLRSEDVSQRLEAWFAGGRSVSIIIGGAYGVSPELHSRATEVWSLSRLVFPHQLVRLILAEQLYRAQQIARGSAYHHS
ncbi:50S rRNA methyltransferase [Candidatus Saccharibacteria bacterium]|nr:MAG: 50S rRNA methyltransferase [Candidatus Saccharibacteria bacterium]